MARRCQNMQDVQPPVTWLACFFKSGWRKKEEPSTASCPAVDSSDTQPFCFSLCLHVWMTRHFQWCITAHAVRKPPSKECAMTESISENRNLLKLKEDCLKDEERIWMLIYTRVCLSGSQPFLRDYGRAKYVGRSKTVCVFIYICVCVWETECVFVGSVQLGADSCPPWCSEVGMLENFRVPYYWRT